MKRRTFLSSILGAVCLPIAIQLAPMLRQPVKVEQYELETTDCYWTGDLDSDWGKPGNWKNGRVPKDGDDVFITTGGNVNMKLKDAVDVKNLTITSGSLHIADDYKGTIG